MSRAPLLSTPEPGDILMIYLSVSATTISSVLIRPKESTEHQVHYVGKALQDAEVRYPDIDKLQKPEASGRLVKWAIELGEFDMHYKPPQATKGQAVADFISKFIEPQASATTQIVAEPNLPSSADHVASNGTLDLTQPLWTLYVDGSSNA
ncbi:hypothetical protein L3X38_017091 [Prunus dulcis]|uniref:Reverse transcriptase/retrotransposon-derived protein RNase H-like domain-containing protein n=1 Tax=Prunus dulcis TaxID=3755 RepID=A0AAD4W6H3_PRUDU|nr:hypothetical protein L3X38_017091 [Prunus dulcis]